MDQNLERVNSTDQNQQTVQSPRKFNKKILVIAVFILLLLIVIPSTLYFLNSKNTVKTVPSTNSISANSNDQNNSGSLSAQINQQKVDDSTLLSIADNTYANGNVPLGDGKYTTTGPKKGYIYLCHLMNGGGGAQHAGPWIHGSTWNPSEKISVQGSVSWPNAKFSNTVSGDNRTLSGNALPVGFTSGIFPIKLSDPASSYDKNPNSITAQDFKEIVSTNPVYSDTPYCMGGEVGVMLDGVPLFNGFDAAMRDAAANEVQDSCSAHPQEKGEYHYHSLSKCFKDIGVKTVLGYALDGFPITGPQVAKDKYLTTEDLDECHGIVSDITVVGKTVTTYHYVMTQDFPYSASCFRGKPIQSSGLSQTGQSQNPQASGLEQGNKNQQPPAEAVNACSGKSDGASCSFTSPKGDTISGTCKMTHANNLACVPQ